MKKYINKKVWVLYSGGSAKSPGREFLMDYEKDKTGNFERGYS